MRRVVLNVASIALLCSALTTTASVHRPLDALDIDIPAAYYPGQSSTQNAACDVLYEPEYINEICYAGDLSFEYDIARKRITAVYKDIHLLHITLGDLIARYGSPVSASYSTFDGILVWSDGMRALWWLPHAHDFGPSVEVFYIYRSDYDITTVPWRGFISSVVS